MTTVAVKMVIRQLKRNLFQWKGERNGLKTIQLWRQSKIWSMWLRKTPLKSYLNFLRRKTKEPDNMRCAWCKWWWHHPSLLQWLFSSGDASPGYDQSISASSQQGSFTRSRSPYAEGSTLASSHVYFTENNESYLSLQWVKNLFRSVFCRSWII